MEIPEPSEEDAHWYDEDLDGIHNITASEEDQGWTLQGTAWAGW